MIDSHLAHACKELVDALDSTADKIYPNEIADVVKLHSKLAVGSAWIPVPGADVAAGAATIWTMYLRINSKLCMELGESVIKTIASAVCTNLVSYAAVSGVGSALKLIPGLGTVAGAVMMSAALYAVTLCSGYVYIQSLTYLLKNHMELNSKNLSDVVNSFIKENAGQLKNFIKEAKKEYKSNPVSDGK